MSPVIQIESFPKRNGPHIAGVITAYTGIYGAAELLKNLPAKFEVEPETLEDLRRQLEQLGCNQDVVTIDRIDREAEPTLKEEQAAFLKLLAESTPRFFITPSLVALNVLVFGAMVLTGVSPVQPTIEQLLLWGANFGPFTLDDQWWRLLSSTFVHIGVFHLAVNMWVLWDLGRLAERMFGNWTFLILYLFSGLGGSIASLLWNPRVVSAGASGAVFGVAGGLVAFWYLGKLEVPRRVIKNNLNSILVFVGYNLFYGFGQAGIDNAAHAGGLVIGLVIGALLHRPLPPPEKYSRVRYSLVCSGVALSLVAGAAFVKTQSTDQTVKVFAAGKLLDAGELDKAIPQLEAALAVEPDHPLGNFFLGVAYARKGLQDEAIGLLKKTVELKPDFADAYYFLGALYFEKGDYVEAIAPLRKTLELEPNHAGAQSMMEVLAPLQPQ